MSRPEKPIDWDLVDSMLEAGCEGVKIAPRFNMHVNTFYDRIANKYGMSFTEYSTLKCGEGEANLQHHQYLKALGKTKKGDNSILIHLGKTRLKQVEAANEIAVDANTMKQFGDIMTQLEGFQERKIAERSIMREQKSE
jgi:hypothetical protein